MEGCCELRVVVEMLTLWVQETKKKKRIPIAPVISCFVARDVQANESGFCMEASLGSDCCKQIDDINSEYDSVVRVFASVHFIKEL